MRNILKNGEKKKMRRITLRDKSGYSLGGWIEVSLVVTLFVLLWIALIANMNVDYNKNIDGTMGLNSLATGTQSNMSAYQTTLQQSVAQGSASSTGLGISLTTTWNIISSGATLMWTFITGGFIEQIVALMHVPLIVGTILRILFVISIGLIILRLVLKIVP